MPYLRTARPSQALKLPTAPPARSTGPTPSESDSPPFPGSTRRHRRVSCAAQGAQAHRPGASVKTLLELHFIIPLVHTHASFSKGRTVADRHLACPEPPPFSTTTTPNSTLSIKVSKLAQAPHPPTAPSLSTHKALPSAATATSAAVRALGAARQADADPGGAPGSPPNCDSPRVPGVPIWIRLTLGLGGGAAARGPKERGEEGRWLVG